MIHCNHHSAHRQSGAVLIVSLMILLVLTLIAVVGMQNTTLEEKMASNMRDRNLAFYSAETGLLAGEAELAKAVLPPFDNTNGNYKDPDSLLWSKVDWYAGNAVYTYAATLPGVAEPPRFYLEKVAQSSTGDSLEAGAKLPLETYRVTARAVGSSTTSVVILQSYYRR